MVKPLSAGPGDTMLSIAERETFLDYRSIWNDPLNATLKRVRVNPFCLVPKDVVQIIDVQAKRAIKPTQVVNTFTIALGDAALRLKLLDANGRPLVQKTCRVLSGRFGPPIDLKSLRTATPNPVTDATGLFEVDIARNATDAKIEVLADDDTTVEFDVRVRIGFLPPVNSLAGQRARLNQLGIYAGFAASDTDQLHWAIEEFEHLHGLPLKGRSDNAIFFNKLGHIHGDLLASETLTLPLVATETET